MKLFKLCSLAAMSALLLLTSCLGDSDNTQDWYDVPGVVRVEAGGQFVYTNVISKIQISGVSGYSDGQCAWVSFRYDPEMLGGEGENAYAIVTPLKEPTPITSSRIFMQVIDTTQLLPNEFVVKDAIGIYNNYRYYGYFDDCFFFSSVYDGLAEQKNVWELYFDTEQKPESRDYNNPYTGAIQKINVYSAYLRARISSPGKENQKKENMFDPNAYNIKNAVTLMNSKEKSANNEIYGVNIKYLSAMSSDSTKLTWSDSWTTETPSLVLAVTK